MQVRSRSGAREFKSGDRPDLKTGTLPLEGFNTILSTTANHWRTCGTMHNGVFGAYFHAKAHRPVLLRLPVQDRIT